MTDRKFVFIAGLHRSGTTLLSNLLAGHPDVSGFENTGAPMDEGQHLQTVYPVGRVWGGDAVGRFGFDPCAYLTERSSIATRENAEKLFNEWSKHWDLSKPVLVEKSPPNIIRTRFLQAMFPNSYFIVITRHPVAASIAVKKWCARNPVPGIMMNWTVCHERYRRDRRKLVRCLEIRYEDLVASPMAELEKISSFLRIDPFSEVNNQVRTGINDKYFTRWREITAGAWGGAIETASRLTMEKSFQAFGYSLDDAKLERAA